MSLVNNEYHAQYNLKRYYTRRDEFRQLLGGVCVTCGSNEKLEFDHIDAGTKSFPIGKLLSVSKEKALLELAKCQLLCKDCHVAKTKVAGDWKNRTNMPV